MLFQEYQSELVARVGEFTGTGALETTVKEDLRERLLGDRVREVSCGSAPLSPELKRFVESCLELPLRDGYGTTETGVVLIDSALGDRVQARRRARTRLPQHGPAVPARRVAAQDRDHHSRVLQAPRGDGRGLRRGRLLPDRRHHGRDRTGPARIPRPPRQRPESAPGRVRHPFPTGARLRHRLARPADLHLRQQRTRLPARRDRAHRGGGEAGREPGRAQLGAARIAATGRTTGRVGVVRDPPRLPGRDRAVQRGERPAVGDPQGPAPPGSRTATATASKPSALGHAARPPPPRRSAEGARPVHPPAVQPRHHRHRTACFYHTDDQGNCPRAHCEGLPVDSIARAVNTLGAGHTGGYRTYNASTPRRRPPARHLRRLAHRRRPHHPPRRGPRHLIHPLRDCPAGLPETQRQVRDRSTPPRSPPSSADSHLRRHIVTGP
ncbi:AMP-binding protein [Streptomyces canus]